MTVSLVRYQPFTELRKVVDRLFDERFFAPYRFFAFDRSELNPIDVYQTENEMVVKATVPGVKPEDVDINIADNILTIKGETEAEDKIERKDYLYQEHRYGTFRRSVVLPRGLKAEKAEASFENGVLTLSIPKGEESKPKRIKVKAKVKSTSKGMK